MQVADKIKKEGGNAEAISCDITQENAVKTLIDQVIKKYHQIDILVNNAGVAVLKNFEDHTLDDWNYVMDTNLKGAFLMSRAVVFWMKKQKSGKIIFVSSIAGSMGCPELGAYSASKGGMLAMAKTMTTELAQYNINVNFISPGATETPMNQVLLTNPVFLEKLAQRTASGGAMKPNDIAGAAVFFASNDSKAIHGLDLIVDDGWRLL